MTKFKVIYMDPPWAYRNKKTGGSEKATGNIHVSVKPLKLMSYLVTLGSIEGDTVLDPFMGSGTTGIACKILKRNFIGIEKEEEYFTIAEKRIGVVEDVLL